MLSLAARHRFFTMLQMKLEERVATRLLWWLCPLYLRVLVHIPSCGASHDGNSIAQGILYLYSHSMRKLSSSSKGSKIGYVLHNDRKRPNCRNQQRNIDTTCTTSSLPLACSTLSLQYPSLMDVSRTAGALHSRSTSPSGLSSFWQRAGSQSSAGALVRAVHSHFQSLY